MFKIVGFGDFGTALHRVITLRGGVVSNTDYEWLIPCVPSVNVKEVVECEERQCKVLIVSKGMSNKMFLSELIGSMGFEYAVMAGPQFASELRADLPTKSTIATVNPSDFEDLKPYFPSPVGSCNPNLICLASVFKNIAAFVCGVFEALQMGENAKACMVSEALSQLNDIAYQLGFIEQRLSIDELIQPAIAGDMILSCNSQNSRNFKAGMAAVEGTDVDFIVESSHSARILKDRLGEDKRYSILEMACNRIDLKKAALNFFA